MDLFFTICAAAGGTVLVCQLILLLTGLSGHGDGSGGDVGHDVSLDHADGHGLPAGKDFHLASKEVHPTGSHQPQIGPSLLVCMLSLRGIVAGIAFFGLGGLIARQAGAGIWLALPAGFILGIAAMGLVGLFTRSIQRMRHEGTLNIAGAVGKRGRVYLTIPARKAGVGKVTIELQNRTAEFPAVTAYPESLPTGAEITVVALVEQDTLEVVPLGFDRSSADV